MTVPRLVVPTKNPPALRRSCRRAGSLRRRILRGCGRGQGGLVYLVHGCRGDAEFGGDRIDRMLGHVEGYPAVGGVVGTDVSLVVLLNFITGQPVEEQGDVIDSQLGLFGDR